MSLRSILFSILSILLLAACSQSRPSSPIEVDADRYDEARAMSYMLSDPPYAMELIDSAYYMDNITDQERQYLKSIVMYNGFSFPDSSMLMCRHLVESEAWNEVTDTILLVNVYSLMAIVAGTLNRHADVIHYAQIAAELSHSHPDLRDREIDMLSRVGRTMAIFGQQEEGMKLMMRAFEEVDDSKSWPSFMAYINVGKKVATTQLEMNLPGEALQTVRGLHQQLLYFKDHAQEFEDLQPSMAQNNQAVVSYVNYNLVRCYANMVNCFAAMGASDSAIYWMNVMDDFPEARAPFIRLNIVPSLVKLHFDNRVLEEKELLAKALGADTMVITYVRLLEAMSELERNRNNLKASNNYLIRALAVRDSVEKESFRSQLSDQLTIYQLQDERLHRMDVEASRTRLVYYSTALSLFLILVTVIGVAMNISRNFKQLKRVHVDTQSELQEAKQKIEKLSQNYVPETPEQLYKRIIYIMDSEQPYTDQNFDIAQLAALVHSNRTYISKVINKMSGLNFRSWLAQYRITLVQQYMKDNPNASLDEICEISGYASRTSLFRNFKAITGHTPTGWMANLDEEQEALETMDDPEISEDSEQ